MPRDLLRQMFDERDRARKKEVHGQTMSKFRLNPFDPAATLMPVADIRVGTSIINDVPLSANNRELLYVNPGTPVTLARSTSGRLEVVGLSKRTPGPAHRYTMQVPQITPDSADSTEPLRPQITTFVETVDYTLTYATLGELATLTEGGFGETPFLALVLRDSGGNIISIN